MRHVHQKQNVNLGEWKSSSKPTLDLLDDFGVLNVVFVVQIALVVLFRGVDFAKLVFLLLHHFLHFGLAVRLKQPRLEQVLRPDHEVDLL